MEQRLIVLKLFLDALGQNTRISTVQDRKRIQKAIYLGQLSGVDLGYRFSWYVMGPYSSTLTKDYYALASSEEKESDQYELNDKVTSKLSKIREIIKKPDDIKLDDASWLELIASWHYLRQVSKKSAQESTEAMKTLKPHLATSVEIAESKFQEISAAVN